MSALVDPDFAAAHDVLFAVFGEAAQVRHPRGQTTPVRVVVTYGVAELGDYGQGLARVTTVKFLNSEWRVRPADILLLASGSHRIDRIVVDDGLVTEVVVYG